MTLIRFPFQRIGGVLQPVIPIGIKLGFAWQRVDVYIDSGATFTVLKARIAERYNFDYRQGNPVNIQVGDGRLIRIYLHNLDIQIGSERFTCPIGFSDNLGVPFNVLGKRAHGVMSN